MTYRIAVTISKGGQGKTTTAVHLAAGLANAGDRVLLVETDTQAQCVTALGASPPLADLYEFVTGRSTAADAMTEARPDLFVMPGGDGIAQLERYISQLPPEQDHRQVLNNALTGLDDFFDYVIVDTGPGWDVLAVNVLVYAPTLLCPVIMEPLAAAGLFAFLERSQRLGTPQLRYLVPTMFDRRLLQTGEVLEQLAARYPEQMCEPIPRSVRLSEAPAHGLTIWEYDPAGPAAEAYSQLINKVRSDNE